MARMVIDDREHKFVKMIKAEPEFVIKYEVSRLPIGDYMLYCNDVCIAIVERKTWSDLSASIMDGRKDNVNKLLAFRSVDANVNKCKIIYIIEGTYRTNTLHILPAKNLVAHLDHLTIRDNIHVIYTNTLHDTMLRMVTLINNSMTLDEIKRKPKSRPVIRRRTDLEDSDTDDDPITTNNANNTGHDSDNNANNNTDNTNNTNNNTNNNNVQRLLASAMECDMSTIAHTSIALDSMKLPSVNFIIEAQLLRYGCKLTIKESEELYQSGITYKKMLQMYASGIVDFEHLSKVDYIIENIYMPGYSTTILKLIPGISDNTAHNISQVLPLSKMIHAKKNDFAIVTNGRELNKITQEYLYKYISIHDD